MVSLLTQDNTEISAFLNILVENKSTNGAVASVLRGVVGVNASNGV
jgi:hypothetical protein